MSQQGEQRGPRPAEQNDWWSELYDPEAPDTGGGRAGDTLDDLFASVTRTVGPDTAAAIPSPRTGRSVSDPDPGPEPGPDPAPETYEPPEPGPWTQPDMERSSTGDADPGTDTGPETDTDPETDEWPVTETGSGAASRFGKGPGPEQESDLDPAPEVTPNPGPESGPGPVPEFDPAPPPGPDPRSGWVPETGPAAEPVTSHVGEAPPAYDPEPTTLPRADPSALGELTPDTVLDGAQYGPLTLRAVSLRGDSSRYRAALRQEALLTARFGEGEQALLLIAIAAGPRGTADAHRAAREICHSIGGAVGRSHARLAEDIRDGRRSALKSGLNRLTDRAYGKLRAQAAALGLEPEEYTADLRCLLLSADPGCATRVFFGVGSGGLFRLREGEWQDIEPSTPATGTVGGPVLAYGAEPLTPTTPDQDRRATMELGTAPDTSRTPDPMPPGPAPPGFAPAGPRPRPFRFRASIAQKGDTLLLCSAGLAEPLRGEPGFADELAARWAGRPEPPGLAAFLGDVQLRVRGYANDRTAAAIWEG